MAIQRRLLSRAIADTPSPRSGPDRLEGSRVQKAVDRVHSLHKAGKAGISKTKVRAIEIISEVKEISREQAQRLLGRKETAGEVISDAATVERLDQETVEFIADGGEDFRDAIYEAAEGDAITSYKQIDRVIQKIDNLGDVKKQRARQFISNTDRGAGLHFIDKLDKSADVQYLLSQDPAIRVQLVDWYLNPGRHIDPALEPSNAIHVARNGNVEQTHVVVKGSDKYQDRGNVQWLEEGDSKSGFKHIRERHVTEGQFYSIDGIRSLEDVKNAIQDTIKNGKPTKIPDSDGGGTAYVYSYTSDSDITVIVSSNGYVVTARPGDYP